MSDKQIAQKELDKLRSVLRGNDQEAMWKQLHRLKLSPIDKVGK